MPLRFSRNPFTIALVLCGLAAVSLQIVAQKKGSSTPAKKPASAGTEALKPIAVHPFSVEGVEVALMEVMRTAPEVVTVKWEYRNKTAKPQELARDSKGWSDPYRLSINTYLLGSDGKTKMPVMRDEKRVPVASAIGRPNQLTIAVPAGKSVKTWAKYSVPAAEKTVTVVITGADPFEGVEVKEPPQPSGK